MLKKAIYPIVSMIMAILMISIPVLHSASASPSTVTFTVNSTLDQPDDLTMPGTCHTAVGSCTLRAAAMQANRTSGTGATIIVPAGIYTLTIPLAGVDGEENGDLNLTTPGSGSPVITITGAGASATVIDANQLDRVIHVHPGRVVAISNVTIRNGYFQGVPAYGGGIYNEGSLTLSYATISANHSISFGGGIMNSGSLTVMNSTLSQNYADYYGGGIFNQGSLDVINNTLSQNTSDVGGAIYNAGGMKVKNSTIYGNGANDGGGISNGIDTATLYVINSTISQNYADNNGGGIINNNGLTALYNTSVIGNDADHDRDVNGGNGGGVYSDAIGRFIVVNSLISANTLLNSPIYDDCNGMLEAYGMNLFYDVSACSIPNAGNWGYVTLNTVGSLQNNGGPTWTHALLPGSEAIDTTFDNLGCVDDTGALLTTDQRGLPRVAGLRCDVGAYEYNPLGNLYLPLVVR